MVEKEVVCHVTHYQNEVIQLVENNNGAVAMFRPFTVAGCVVKSIGVITSFLIPCWRQARNLCDGDVVCVCLFVTLCSLTRYLKKGNSDSSQTRYIDAPY